MTCNICVKDVAKSLSDPLNVMELINYLHRVCVCVCNYVNLRVYLCECLHLHTAVACSLSLHQAKISFYAC